MQKSIGSDDQKRLAGLLKEVRRGTGISQQVLAGKLKRPQSFIPKYESGQRRIDVVEFVTIARAMGADPLKLFGDFLSTKMVKPSRKKPAK